MLRLLLLLLLALVSVTDFSVVSGQSKAWYPDQQTNKTAELQCYSNATAEKMSWLKILNARRNNVVLLLIITVAIIGNPANFLHTQRQRPYRHNYFAGNSDILSESMRRISRLIAHHRTSVRTMSTEAGLNAAKSERIRSVELAITHNEIDLEKYRKFASTPLPESPNGYRCSGSYLSIIKSWRFSHLWIMIQIVVAVLLMIWIMVCKSFNHSDLIALR